MAKDNELFLAARFGRSPSSTLQGRREAEARTLAPRDRRLISTAQRRERQLNLKVTSEVYDAFALRARMRGVSMPDFLEILLKAEEAKGPR